MINDVAVGEHENIVKGAIERELRRIVMFLMLWHEKMWKYCKKLQKQCKR